MNCYHELMEEVNETTMGNHRNQHKRRRFTKPERMKILKKTNGHCAYCGCKIAYNEMQIDHVVPIRNGGKDLEENMLPACRSCNHYKGACSLSTFRKLVENMPSALNRDNVTYRNAVRFGLVVPKPHKVKFYFEKQENKK